MSAEDEYIVLVIVVFALPEPVFVPELLVVAKVTPSERSILLVPVHVAEFLVVPACVVGLNVRTEP